MKIIQQHDERDCGAACLSMIASYYGLNYNISKFRELTKTDRNGTNLYGIVDGAEKIGFKAEALSGSVNELLCGISAKEIKFPFIAHIVNQEGMYHFVVVFGIKKGILYIGDPGKGKCKMSVERFAECWTGHIVTFIKNKDFQRGNYKKGGIVKFFYLLKGQKRILFGVIVMSLIVSVISIAGAFVFESVIDNFYNENNVEVCVDGCTENHTHITENDVKESKNLLDKIVAFISKNANNFNSFFMVLILLYIVQCFTDFLRGCLLAHLSKNIDIKLMLSYYNHVVDLPMSEITTRNTGEYLSRFSDASAIRDAVSGATLTLILDSVMAIACGVFLYFENRVLFLVSLIMVVLYAIVVFIYKNPIENVNRNIMEDNAGVESFLKESIDGISTIKANQAEKTIKNKNKFKFYKLMKSVFRGNVLEASLGSICGVIELVGTVIILWIGFGMVKLSVISVGSLISFYALLSYFSAPIKNVINLQPLIQTAIVAADRLNDILDIESEYSLPGETKKLLFYSAEFRNINFRYGNKELTIKDLSLKIKKGEKIAIVGESGSGKTTIARLLLKFYKPESGKILINGKDIKDYNHIEIRSMISYINQETFLFSDSIKNNLLLGNPNATDKEIEQVCISLNLENFIKSLPFGYETYLDENGLNLSGGQRQRLSIARALLKKPQVLILDEATSNLDTVTENGIKNAVFNLNEDLTCIIIAHRLNTIRNCDRIIVMNKGSVVEIGTHDELMKKKGMYFKYIENCKY